MGDKVKVILAAVGILILLITSASHPVHDTLLSDTKYKVIKLSLLVIFPMLTLPEYDPFNVALVSLPSYIFKTSLSFSVQKLLKDNVMFFAPGSTNVMIIFSLWS